MLLSIIFVIIILLIFGPQIWTRYVFSKYSKEIPELPGSGGELAQHLIEKLDLTGVTATTTELGDHYNPLEKTVCLSEETWTGKSLTSVVIAAHEIGHALQDKYQYRPLVLRTRLAGFVSVAEKVAAFFLVSFPFIALLTKLPVVGGVMLLTGILVLLLPVLFHLITLPVELDASFNRALPILIEGKYLPDNAESIVRSLLTAAAFTYLSASLASLLNFYRWIAILRR